MKNKETFFSKQLKKILSEKRLTHRELAEKIGVNRPMISRWIAVGRNPSLNSIKKLSDVLEVPLSYFIESKNKDRKNNKNLDKKDIEILKLKNEILNLRNKNLELEKEILELKLKT